MRGRDPGRRPLVGLLAGILLLASVAHGQPSPSPAKPAPTATVSFLDVGQGDGVLIRSPEGKTALVDAGPSKSVVATLRTLGVDHLDLLAISHHHADHYGGA